MNAASLHGVTLAHGKRSVLHTATLALRQGEFVGLFGPNGAGKTTLLRALLGLHRPCAGTIDILGAPARPGRADIGYLPQSGADPFPPVTGRDLLHAGLNPRAFALPTTRRADHAAIETALAATHATHLAGRPITCLSGGERQRVLIAQSLLGNPRLLLLDEPLHSLDPLAQRSIVALLRDLQRRLALTILCSAHDLNVLLPAIDRVLYIGNGHAALGTLDEVVTGSTLSRLYGGAIDVIRADGRVFVVPA